MFLLPQELQMSLNSHIYLLDTHLHPHYHHSHVLVIYEISWGPIEEVQVERLHNCMKIIQQLSSTARI